MTETQPHLYTTTPPRPAVVVPDTAALEGLEDKWSKDRILATWMNQVYFGNHAYGVEAAAQTYFSRHAKDLTLMQAACWSIQQKGIVSAHLVSQQAQTLDWDSSVLLRVLRWTAMAMST